MKRIAKKKKSGTKARKELWIWPLVNFKTVYRILCWHRTQKTYIYTVRAAGQMNGLLQIEKQILHGECEC